MEGVAGIFRFDGAPPELPRLRRMLDSFLDPVTLEKTNRWSSDVAALGSSGRSSIEVPAGRFALSFDGRLDNNDELRSALGNHGPKEGSSDAILVQAALDRWGEEAVHRLDGDFALIAWDTLERRLLLARDPMGNRPLYYFDEGKALLVASDVRALLDAADRSPQLNRARLAQFLADCLESSVETPWIGVHALPAAHFLAASDKGLKTERYWTPSAKALPPLRTLDDHAAYYRSLLFDRVRRSSRSAEPLAFEVSGGLDSSALFLVANALLNDGQLLAPDITAYTITFPEGDPASELRYSRSVAKAAGRALIEVQPTIEPPEEFVASSRREGMFAELPTGIMAAGLRDRAQADGSRALVSGVGGDEWLGDPWFHRLFLVEQIASRDLVGLGRSIASEHRAYGTRSTAYAFLRFGLFPFLPEPVRRALKRVRDVVRGSPRQLADRFLSAELASYLSDVPPGPPPIKATRHYSRDRKAPTASDAYAAWGWGRIIQSARAQGIEMRAPYRSKAFVEWSMAVPASFMTEGRVDRLIHRLALKDLLPPELYARVDKADFSDFVRGYLVTNRHYFRDLAERRSDWFGAETPSTLVDDLAAAGPRRRGDLSEIDAMWGLCAALAADGLPV